MILKVFPTLFLPKWGYWGRIDLSWKWQNKFTKTVKLSIIYNETFLSIEFYRKIKFANLLPN